MGNEAIQTKIVPAICTQCSAQITVDSSQDAAICPHCGTAFIVEKAVKNYLVQGIQNTNVEHIDTVNINTTAQHNPGSALYFIDKHLDRRTARKIERDRLRAEREKRQAETTAMIYKYMPFLVIVSLIAVLGMFYFMTRG